MFNHGAVEAGDTSSPSSPCVLGPHTCFVPRRATLAALWLLWPTKVLATCFWLLAGSLLSSA